ncbi:hypothetical protein HMPREF3196_00026 [Bifidobacterium bifidum]|uniref:Uncharacterized protein n=1 Tax=Bifidobacterium bifidum TaxID=1681 RepID=A0A133KUH6_BIFBI|nr:hypothetical protein HMPREF3196_00026 [Bifidobacterium bifidum]
MTAVRAHESGLSMRVLPAGEGGSWGQSPLLGLITGESVQDSVRARTRTPQPLACDGMLEW